MLLGQIRRLAKRRSNLLLIPLRVLRPIRASRRRIDADNAIRPRPQLAKFLADPTSLLHRRHKILPIRIRPHRRSTPRRRPNRRHH